MSLLFCVFTVFTVWQWYPVPIPALLCSRGLGPGLSVSSSSCCIHWFQLHYNSLPSSASCWPRVVPLLMDGTSSCVLMMGEYQLGSSCHWFLSGDTLSFEGAAPPSKHLLTPGRQRSPLTLVGEGVGSSSFCASWPQWLDLPPWTALLVCIHLDHRALVLSSADGQEWRWSSSSLPTFAILPLSFQC